MEVMHRAIVKSRSLKPLPGEITNQRINDATLPVKIEAARRAIAECTDLPELLRYKSQAEGLAAAVRTMKEVGPAMIRSANEMMADAWRKGGELLSAYSGVASDMIRGEKGLARGRVPSARKLIANKLGLSRRELTSMVRIAAASKEKVYELANKSHNMQSISLQVPTIGKTFCNNKKSSAYLYIMGSSVVKSQGLNSASSALKKVRLDQFQHLTPDERKVVKAKITELTELLDEMDRLCR